MHFVWCKTTTTYFGIDPKYNDRFFEAFDVYHALKVNERNKQYIYLENRQTQGTENIYGLLHAIKNRLIVTFSYQKFYTNHPEQRTVNSLAWKNIIECDCFSNFISKNWFFGKNTVTQRQIMSLKSIIFLSKKSDYILCETLCFLCELCVE